MQAAPLILLEATDDERVDITLQEYVHDALREFVAAYGDDTGFERWAEYLFNSLDRIHRRLGGERHATVRSLLQTAIDEHARRGDSEAHRAWIAYLLHEYYDGMYGYQLSQKAERTVFQGRADEVIEFLAERFDMRSLTS